MSDGNSDIPVQPVQAWTDGRGHLYPTKEAALLVEIERVLGHFGTGESMAPGIARLIASKRDELVPLLTAFGSDSINANPNDGPQSDLPLFVWKLIRVPNEVQNARGWTGALVLVLLVLFLFVSARLISNHARKRLGSAR